MEATPDLCVGLLSREAEILVMLLDEPALTISEMAQRLEVSERGVARSMTNLVRAKMVRRTKVGVKYHYEIVKTTLENMPDSTRLQRLAGIFPTETVENAKI